MAASATVAFENLFPFPVPTFGPSIPKCSHSVYDPHNGGKKAEYCGWCTPDGPHGTRKVELPRNSDIPLTAPDMRANLHSCAANECPGCHSRIYVVVNEKTNECADCGEKYPATKKRIYR